VDFEALFYSQKAAKQPADLQKVIHPRRHLKKVRLTDPLAWSGF
jgi:hypothetical protein